MRARRYVAGDRSDEDDTATVSRRVDWGLVGWRAEAFGHAGGAGLGDEKGAVEIDCQSAVDVALGGVKERLIGHYTGGVDVDVDPAEVLLDAGDGILDFREGANIACVVFDSDAMLRAKVEELVRRGGSDVDSGDVAICFCED